MKKFYIRLILLLFCVANIWTVFTIFYFPLHFAGLLDFTISFDYTGIVFTAIAYIFWLASFKLMPKVDVTDVVLRRKYITRIRPLRRFLLGIWYQIWTSFLFLPLSLKYLVLGFKYRNCVVMGASFDDRQWYSIVLKHSEFREYDNRGMSKSDLDEYFIVVNGVCVIKDSESASYLSLKYTDEQILRSFGYFGGLKEEDKHSLLHAVKAAFGYEECPLTRKAMDRLQTTNVTPNIVCDHVYYI